MLLLKALTRIVAGDMTAIIVAVLIMVTQSNSWKTAQSNSVQLGMLPHLGLRMEWTQAPNPREARASGRAADARPSEQLHPYNGPIIDAYTKPSVPCPSIAP